MVQRPNQEAAVEIHKPEDETRWKQNIRRHKSAYGARGATNELFFYNPVNSPVGQIVAAGIGQRGKLANRWAPGQRSNFLERHYSLVMILKDSNGFYHNETGFECPLSHGDFFLGIPGHSHRFGQSDKETWGELCVEFEGKMFDVLRRERVLSFDFPVWHLESPEPWIARLEALLRAPRPTSPLAGARETTSFLTLLLEMLETAVPKEASSADNWFNNACVMLSSDLSKPLKLKKVADKLYMGYENFRVKFRRQAGMAAGQYRDQQRCKAACDHLVNTRKPCWEIALYLGFCDEQHFSRRFKKWTGMPPQTYRSKHTALKR